MIMSYIKIKLTKTTTHIKSFFTNHLIKDPLHLFEIDSCVFLFCTVYIVVLLIVVRVADGQRTKNWENVNHKGRLSGSGDIVSVTDYSKIGGPFITMVLHVLLWILFQSFNMRTLFFFLFFFFLIYVLAYLLARA